MTTELIPDTQGSSERQNPPQSRPAQQRGDRRDSSPYSAKGRWWWRGLLAVGVVAVLAAAAVLIPGTISSPQTGARLTHTIKRGDLVVTVTEQGTLESSNNTEIKCKVRGFNTVNWVIPGGTVVQPGDELVRLDTKVIEETVSLQKTNVHIATATLAETQANVAAAEIAISAYLEGRYRSQLKSLERELAIAESNLLSAKKVLKQTETLYARGYVNFLELEASTLAVKQADFELKVKQTQIDVLEQYTKEMELVSLNGNVTATKSKLEADKAGLKMDETRRDRALEELENCVIRAPRGGLVIYPTAAAWKNAPDITEGATVAMDQVLLIMPDLSRMQVKVGIHESIIDRIKPGLLARITLPDRMLDAKVSSIASATRPAGWWTGNVVKYDTIIELPSEQGLKPGMSAEVEVIIARHEDVLTVPVAAIVATEEGDFCWIQTADGAQKRSLQLGDTNDVFIVVKAGLKEGDEVLLNPLAFLEEAQKEALQTLDESKPRKGVAPKPANQSRQPMTSESEHVD